jgi:hypothetical protein
MTEQAPLGVDSAVPNVARMYDYLLGGKDNFAADRAAAEHFLAVIPDIAAIAVDNRVLADGHGVAMAHADLTQPAAVLDHPEVRRVLDLSQPLALICTATLYFVPDSARPHAVIAEYRDRMAAGSHLVLSHAPGEAPAGTAAEEATAAVGVYRQASAQLNLRALPDIRRFLDGFELVEPGVVWMPEWRPVPGAPPAGRAQSLYAAVGRKP